jgi:integron cassette protein
MALSISDIDDLQAYLNGVLERATHHAQNVDGIALTLIGAIIWKKDRLSIRVAEREGETKNVLWVSINDTRYAFTYDHNNAKIVVRHNSIQGHTVHSFDNATSLAEVIDAFNNF